MEMPDKIYLNKYMIRKGMMYPAQPPADVSEEEYIRKDALMEWTKRLYEAYRKKYDESNHTCGEHWGQMVAFQQMIDKLNSL